MSQQHNMVSLVSEKLFADRISSSSRRQTKPFPQPNAHQQFISIKPRLSSFSTSFSTPITISFVDCWWYSSVLSIFPSCQKVLLVTFMTINFCISTGYSTHVGHPLNWQVTWRESLTWRSVLCVTSRQTPSQPFRRVSLQTLASHRRDKIGDNPAPVVSPQGSSPTSWSLSLMSGTVLLSPVCSAGPWWVTCTRTRPTGAACATHALLQARKRTIKLTSPSLREALEKKTGRISLNLPLGLFFCGPVNRKFYPCLSSQALKVSAR